MKLDYSWESLFKPGNATDYFNAPEPAPLNAGAASFNVTNAWWLAEISRLVYHNNFFENNNIQLGSFNYELVVHIENVSTSTHVTLLKVIQDSPCFVIAFRGTDEFDDWNINAHSYQSSFNNKGKVHSGFKKAYLSVRDELLKYLENNSLPIFITGHSLGAALAVLACSELYTLENFDSCYTFGSPRIGNMEFFDSLKSAHIYRIVNNSDIVTTVPIDFATIKYNHMGSPYLFDSEGNLHKEKSDDEIYAYQKSRLESLKDYAISKIINNDFNSIKDDLPSFLADHSPINYSQVLQTLLQKSE